MLNVIKRPKLVGDFIRKRREALGLSQRALGMLFSPAVTTQFISNVERGVTPLPPVHIPTLSKALAVTETELTTLLEKEFTLKLSGRLGRATDMPMPLPTELTAPNQDVMRSLYDAYQQADPQTRQAFASACESLLKISLPKTSS